MNSSGVPARPPGRVRRACLAMALSTCLRPARAEEAPPRPPPMVSLGLDLQSEVRAKADFGLAPGWQAGVHAVAAAWEDKAYDRRPELGLQCTKLWIAEGEGAEGGEYVSAVAGAYWAYTEAGDRAGPRPWLGLACGRYWRPFRNLPGGLDLSLQLARVFSGDLRARSELGATPLRSTIFTVGVSVFWLP